MNNKIYLLRTENGNIILTFNIKAIAEKLKPRIEDILGEKLNLKESLLNPDLNLIKDLHERGTLK